MDKSEIDFSFASRIHGIEAANIEVLLGSMFTVQSPTPPCYRDRIHKSNEKITFWLEGECRAAFEKAQRENAPESETLLLFDVFTTAHALHERALQAELERRHQEVHQDFKKKMQERNESLYATMYGEDWDIKELIP